MDTGYVFESFLLVEETLHIVFSGIALKDDQQLKAMEIHEHFFSSGRTGVASLNDLYATKYYLDMSLDS